MSARNLGVRQIRRAAVRSFATLLPGVAATWFEKVFMTPRRPPSSNVARATLSDGRTTRIPYSDGWLSAWVWGEGPTVLLLHGWSGHSAQLGEFVKPLRAAGFRVVAFDAPAHGESDGQRTNLIEYARATLHVARAFGPFHGIVAHSMGAPTAALAAKLGLDASRVVFLGPAASLAKAAERVAEFLGVPPKVRDLMQRRVEWRLDVPWKELEMSSVMAELDIPLLVFHDEGDREVPWEDGAVIARAAKRATLVTTSWLGHLRILRDRKVVKQTVDFLAAGRPQVDKHREEIMVSAGPDDRSDIVVNAGVVT